MAVDYRKTVKSNARKTLQEELEQEKVFQDVKTYLAGTETDTKAKDLIESLVRIIDQTQQCKKPKLFDRSSLNATTRASSASPAPIEREIDTRHYTAGLDLSYDDGKFTLGKIGQHNVVMACTDDTGTHSGLELAILIKLSMSWTAIDSRSPSRWFYNGIRTWWSRRQRAEHENNPKVHYGTLASSSVFIRTAEVRGRVAAELDALSFRTDAPGITDIIPCLMIRGISDYSDSHKNKAWQGYAAMAAAAYAKELVVALGEMVARRGADSPPWFFFYSSSIGTIVHSAQMIKMQGFVLTK